jgi:spore maturation protein SpmA
MAKVAVMDIALPLTGVMTFFLGILNVGEKAGIINGWRVLSGRFLTSFFPKFLRITLPMVR